MHELGLVKHVMEAVEKIAEEEHLTEVKSVTLEVGEASAIIPEFLTDCWKWAHVKSELLKGAELKLEEIPAVSICEDCNKTYSTMEFKKQCPYCEGSSTYLVSGGDFTIKEIEAC